MKNSVRLITIALGLYMTACAPGTSASEFTDVYQSPVTGEPTEPEDITVFKHWNSGVNEINLNLKSYELDVAKNFFIDMYDNGAMIRQCRGTVLFEGTIESGTFTLTGARTIWRQNTHELDIYCQIYNGVYEYEVVEGGIYVGLQGEEPTLYTEVIEQPE